jgi:uncharacterized membrane protein (UPF0127 family)
MVGCPSFVVAVHARRHEALNAGTDNRSTPTHRSKMIAQRILLALIVAFFGSSALAQGAPQLNLPTVQIQAGMHNIRAQVAIEPQQRSTGLMFRREMPQHEGMLFVFETPFRQCFWMMNTLLPLSIAFIADDGTVVDLQDMQPGDLNSHCSSKPVRYALEMNQGWFAKRGIKPGYKLVGAPFAAR